MKKLILLSLISTQLHAGDLIFKNGFEAGNFVSGTATGLIATGLNLKLEVNGVTENLIVDNNGEFSFQLEVAIGGLWTVDINYLPNNPQQQSCILSNATGIMPVTGVNTIQVQCNSNAWNWDEMNWQESGWN